jgi:hypothetical protein
MSTLARSLDLSFCFEWSISSVPRLNYFLASVTVDAAVAPRAFQPEPATLQTSDLTQSNYFVPATQRYYLMCLISFGDAR